MKKKIVISKEMLKTALRTVLKTIAAGVLIWGIIFVFNLFMKDDDKLMSTEIIDVSSFRGRIFSSYEVSNMPSSCIDVDVDKSTALSFDSTALLIYHNKGMVIWKPDNVTKNVGLCYNYVSPGTDDGFYYRVKYSSEKKEIIFYIYKDSSLGSAIFVSACLFILAIFIWGWLWFKIEEIID